MLFMGIIWGPAFKYKDEILKDTGGFSKKMLSLDLQLDEKYSDFVYDMYEYEDMPKWKIDKKLEHMHANNNSQINVSFYDIDTTEEFYHPYKHCFVYKNVEGMKMYIREKYKDKVDDYFFDTVFHLTDNKIELNHSVEVLSNYLDHEGNKDEQICNVIKNIIHYISNQDVLQLPDHLLEREF